MKKTIVLIMAAAMLVLSCGCEKKVDPKVATGATIEGKDDEMLIEKDEEKDDLSMDKPSNELGKKPGRNLDDDVPDQRPDDDKRPDDEDNGSGDIEDKGLDKKTDDLDKPGSDEAGSVERTASREKNVNTGGGH